MDRESGSGEAPEGVSVQKDYQTDENMTDEEKEAGEAADKQSEESAKKQEQIDSQIAASEKRANATTCFARW